MGGAYYILELLWRGYSHWSMFIIGGFCGVCVGMINQIPAFRNLNVVRQSLIGVAFVLFAEFISGCVLNIWMGLDIWDYSHRFGNIFGQICPLYAVLWFLLMPFVIWLEDWLRWNLWREGSPYGLLSIYREMVRKHEVSVTTPVLAPPSVDRHFSPAAKDGAETV